MTPIAWRSAGQQVCLSNPQSSKPKQPNGCLPAACSSAKRQAHQGLPMLDCIIGGLWQGDHFL